MQLYHTGIRRGIGQTFILIADSGSSRQVAKHKVRTGRHILVLILTVDGINAQRRFYSRIRGYFIGIGRRIDAVIERAAYTQTRYSPIIQTGDISGRGKVVDLEEALLSTCNPVITVETVRIQTRYNQRLIIECGISLTESTEELDTRFVPGGRKNGGFAFRTVGSEKVNGLVMRIGKSDGHNHMSGTDIKSRMYQACNMELLQSDLAAFLYFRFVLSILGVLQLYGRTCTAGFKFYFSPQYPLGIELIIECQYETRDGDRITVVVRISSIAAKET